MYRALRLLAVGVTALAMAVSLDVPAHAAASACTHHLSGPRVCISVTGSSGSANPGRVHTARTNQPRCSTTATVHITEPGGQTYTLTALRHGSRLVASFAPGIQTDGKLCARYQG